MFRFQQYQQQNRLNSSNKIVNKSTQSNNRRLSGLFETNNVNNINTTKAQSRGIVSRK